MPDESIIFALCVIIISISCTVYYIQAIKKYKNNNVKNIPAINLFILKFCKIFYLYYAFWIFLFRDDKKFNNISLNCISLNKNVNKKLINEVTDLENKIRECI